MRDPSNPVQPYPPEPVPVVLVVVHQYRDVRVLLDVGHPAQAERGLRLGVHRRVDDPVPVGEHDGDQVGAARPIGRSESGRPGAGETLVYLVRREAHFPPAVSCRATVPNSLVRPAPAGNSGSGSLGIRYRCPVIAAKAGRVPEDFLWKGRLGPMKLLISDTTFRPSTISALVARELRIQEGEVAIDVGCGSGVLAIIAAKLGARHVHAIDKSPDVIEVGRANAEANDVADRITFYQGDLFEPLADDVRADVIIGDVSGIPDTLADESGWFPTRGGGGIRGSELPIRMLEEASRRLKTGGRLFLPTGSLQDESSIIEAARRLYTKVRKLTERAIPLPSKLATSQALSDLVERGVVRITTRGSRSIWEARVWEVSGVA